MDLRHLRTFVTVTELGTVSKAAARLHVAQPALSRQIASLEDELGVRLFDRVGRRLLLTTEGEELLSDCRDLLSGARALGERAQMLRRGDVGILRVSATPHLIEGVFPELLHRYAKRYPNVQVRLSDVIGPDSFAKLERGEIHLTQGVASALAPVDPRFAGVPFAPMELLAACHPRLKLGKDGEVEIDRLAPHPLLQATTEFLMRLHFDAACRMAGFTPNYVLECRSPHALLAMAEAGHGVAIIPSVLRVRYRVRRLRVTYRGKPLELPMLMNWDKRRTLPAYAKVFCEMVAERVQQTFPIKGKLRRA
jgi:LysR family nitrogen assimilation transcriptional regulator